MRYLLAAFLGLIPAAVAAQAGPKSCSQGYRACLSEIQRSKLDTDSAGRRCSAARSACMETGTWTGPLTGRSWHNVSRN